MVASVACVYFPLTDWARVDLLTKLVVISMRVMVTGGCGFIGSAVVRLLVGKEDCEVLNLDKLTYSGDTRSVKSVSECHNYEFVKADIADATAVAAVISRFKPDAIVHLAAETHVDRSITGPADFIQSNIVGTYVLLEQSRQYWQALSTEQKDRFRFLHISTDEVFGELGEEGMFSETTPYDPSSPYSASKASSDHLVRAWHRTYGLPVLITNCSNNYGPYQYPEKLIPLLILNALGGKPLPVYGAGLQVRDWLHVEDHAEALYAVLTTGKVGESYNVGGNSERRNIDVVQALCSSLDQLVPRSDGSYSDLIAFVADRPGHDFRYAIDASKIKNDLAWAPRYSFEEGLTETVEWYLRNKEWLQYMSKKLASGSAKK